MPYAVFCNRIERGKPEPHMTWGGTDHLAKDGALRDAQWRATTSGQVAEIVFITDEDFLKGNWPTVGQEEPQYPREG
jgi:hypothetical protein